MFLITNYSWFSQPAYPFHSHFWGRGVLCRSGSSYIQGDLGSVKVTSTADGGVYLGASSQYPGSIQSVNVDMSGTGNVVVATSNGKLPTAFSCSSLYIPWVANGVRILERGGVPANADRSRLTTACCKQHSVQ